MDSFIDAIFPSSIMNLLSFIVQLVLFYFVYCGPVSNPNFPKAGLHLDFPPNPLSAGRRILQAKIASLKIRLLGVPCDCQGIMKRYLEIEERCKVLQEENDLLQQKLCDLEDDNRDLNELVIQADQQFKEHSIAMGDMWIEDRNHMEKYQRRLQVDAERKNRVQRRETAQKHEEERARDREAYEAELNYFKKELKDYRGSERFLCMLINEMRDPAITRRKRCTNKTAEVARLEGRVRDVVGMFETQQMITQRLKAELEAGRSNTAELEEKLHIARANCEFLVKAYKRDVKMQKRARVTADGSPIGGMDVARLCYWGDQFRTNGYRNGTLQQRLQLPGLTATNFSST